MTALSLAIANLHLVGPAEVVASCKEDLLREEQVGTHHKVIDESVTVACNMRRDEFRAHTTGYPIGQEIRERSSNHHLFGRHLAYLHVVSSGLLHLTLVDIHCLHSPCGTLSPCFHKGSTAHVHSLHVVHITESERLVSDIADEGRVVEEE